jgi:excisionase family DNA binding protein
MEREHAEFLSQRQAAARFGVSALTLRRKVRDGRLATYVDPLRDNKMLFRASDLEAMQEPVPARRRPQVVAA